MRNDSDKRILASRNATSTGGVKSPFKWASRID
jgi:hypothetical protein